MHTRVLYFSHFNQISFVCSQVTISQRARRQQNPFYDCLKQEYEVPACGSKKEICPATSQSDDNLFHKTTNSAIMNV